MAKSLAGTVIGAAVQRGELDVKAPAAIANWQAPGDPRAAITLDALMRMSSGLTSDTAGNRTGVPQYGGGVGGLHGRGLAASGAGGGVIVMTTFWWCARN